MSDAMSAVAALTSVLQLIANATEAATKISEILTKMNAEGRDRMTPDEWDAIDKYVADARNYALNS